MAFDIQFWKQCCSVKHDWMNFNYVSFESILIILHEINMHYEPPGQNVSIVSQICLILVSNCLKRSQFCLKYVSDKMSQFGLNLRPFWAFEIQLRLSLFESNLRAIWWHFSALSKRCQKGLKNVSKRDLGGFSGWTVFSST